MTVKNKTVLVTGTTGFIAQHIVDKLLQKKYRVIGTARSEIKYQPLLKEYKNKYLNCEIIFEIVEDISIDNAFDEIFIKHPEIIYVIHTASPFIYGLNKPLEDSFLKPAVDGTLNILKAISKYAPQVTNVVLTSSFAAIKQMGKSYTTHIHSNKSWNLINWNAVKNETDAYIASKAYAEKEARKFYEKENLNFKLTTVNPTYVFGPQCFDNLVGPILNVSNEILNTITKIDKDNKLPQVIFGALAIDVRDVAEFHIKAIEDPKLFSERIFIASEPVTGQKVLDILNASCNDLQGKIAKGDPTMTQQLIDENCPKYDISNIINLIGGYEFITLKQSLCDVFEQYFRMNS